MTDLIRLQQDITKSATAFKAILLSKIIALVQEFMKSAEAPVVAQGTSFSLAMCTDMNLIREQPKDCMFFSNDCFFEGDNSLGYYLQDMLFETADIEEIFAKYPALLNLNPKDEYIELFFRAESDGISFEFEKTVICL